jgi:HSP20 family protein
MLVRYRPYRYPVRRASFFPTLWNDAFFSDLWKGLRDLPGEEPKIEMTENKKNYLVRAEFPGFDKDEIKAELEDGVLTLHAETRDEKWDQNEDEGWRSIETSRGSYHRSIVLPEDVKTDKIQATMKKGVLRLTLPRTPEKVSKPKEIEIH